MMQATNVTSLHLIRPRAQGLTALSTSQAKGSLIGPTLWLHCLALLALQTVFLRRRSLSDFAVIDSHAIVQIVIVAASMLFVLLSGRARKIWRLNARNASGWLLLYYVFGAVSSLWSANPAYSFYRSLEVISQIAAIHIALSYTSDFAVAERRVLALILISTLIGMLSVLTNFGFQFNMDYWHTNQYTVPAMIAVTYAFGEIISPQRKNKKFLCLVAGVGTIGLIAGTSSASTLATLGGMCVALFFTPRRGPYKFLLLMLLSALILIMGTSSIEKIIFYGKTQQDVEQWSGRKYMWEGYAEDFTKHPLLGQGFAVSARISTHFKTTNTHNSILSVLLGTGLAGMIFVLLGLARLGRDALRVQRSYRPGAVGSIAAIAAGLANSMSVAFLGETWMMSTFSFICMLALFSMFIAIRPASGPSHRIIIRHKDSVIA